MGCGRHTTIVASGSYQAAFLFCFRYLSRILHIYIFVVHKEVRKYNEMDHWYQYRCVLSTDPGPPLGREHGVDHLIGPFALQQLVLAEMRLLPHPQPLHDAHRGTVSSIGGSSRWHRETPNPRYRALARASLATCCRPTPSQGTRPRIPHIRVNRWRFPASAFFDGITTSAYCRSPQVAQGIQEGLLPAAFGGHRLLW